MEWEDRATDIFIFLKDTSGQNISSSKEQKTENGSTGTAKTPQRDVVRAAPKHKKETQLCRK